MFERSGLRRRNVGAAQIQLCPDGVLTFVRPEDRKFIQAAAAWEGNSHGWKRICCSEVITERIAARVAAQPLPDAERFRHGRPRQTD